MGAQVQCGRCGQCFLAEDHLAGQQVGCPGCGGPIAIPSSAKIEVSCGRCQQRFAADEHLMGTRLPCPACGTEIPIRPASIQTQPQLSAPAATPAPNPLARPSKGKPVNVGLLVGLGVGVVVLIIVGIIGVGVVSNFAGGGGSGSLPTAYNKLEYPPPSFPPRPPLRVIAEEVQFGQVKLNIPTGEPGQADVLYVYLPTGSHPNQSLPCVFITGAGAFPLTGMSLSDGDQPEHLPYVQAGFAVVAYETDGQMENGESATNRQWRNTIQEYWRSCAGLVNAGRAIDYTLARLPEIDPSRLYTAGHSSAGLQALLLAAHDPRIKGCVAYAAVSDLAQTTNDSIDEIRQVLPNIDTLVSLASPRENESRIRCPVMFFHARDDDIVPVAQSLEMASRLKRSGKRVESTLVTRGGHYDPMISEGISKGIAWLKLIDGKFAAPSLADNSAAESAAEKIEPQVPNRVPPKVPVNPDAARQAVAAAAKRGMPDPEDEDYHERLAEILIGSDVFARREAIKVVAAIKPEDVESAQTRERMVEGLRQAAAKGGAWEQEPALNALVQWGGNDNVPFLLAMMADANTFLRRDIFKVLGEIKDPRAAGPVAARLGDFFDKQHAFNCLMKMGPAAEEALIIVAPSNDADVSLAAVQLLGEVGGEKSQAVLRQAMRSRNANVKDAARIAMRKVLQRQESGETGGDPFDQ